jgi:hypothetical protein
MVRVLSYYLIAIGKKLGLLDEECEEAILASSANQYWGKSAHFVWTKRNFALPLCTGYTVKRTSSDAVHDFVESGDLLKCLSCGEFWVDIDATGLCNCCRKARSAAGPIHDPPIGRNHQRVDDSGVNNPVMEEALRLWLQNGGGDSATPNLNTVADNQIVALETKAPDSIDEKLQSIFDIFQLQTKEGGCYDQRLWYYSGPRSIVSRLATADAMGTGQLAFHFEAGLGPGSPVALYSEPEASWLTLWAEGLL